MSLQERLEGSKEAKALWVQSVRIAAHDYTVIHKRNPQQWVITDFFRLHGQEADQERFPADKLLMSQENIVADTGYIPVLI
eukprot:14464698-Ditylum_brightwellii.AAC.1